ncbi:MAG: hypothetical protein GWP91_18350 [Rhodobacterales bacterium]|nr:hypothetical protein [Rhodobacterales bacterium]
MKRTLFVAALVGLLVSLPALADDTGTSLDDCMVQELAIACRNLGTAYADGRGLPQDHHMAVRMFRKGCDLDDGDSCLFLAESHRGARGVQPNQSEELMLFTRACELDVGAACREAGDLYTTGFSGMPPDGSMAGLWYEMGCNARDGASCAAAGLWFERGDMFGVERENAQALFERACDLGSGRGCTLLGVRYDKGVEGLKRDKTRAAALFSLACLHKDAEGCRLQANAQRTGRGVPESLPEAMVSYGSSCDLGDFLACKYLISLAMVNQQYGLASRVAKRSCELGDAKSCKTVERADKRK